MLLKLRYPVSTLTGSCVTWCHVKSAVDHFGAEFAITLLRGNHESRQITQVPHSRGKELDFWVENWKLNLK